MTSRRLDVCLIGAGPRGLSVLERLCANAVSAPAETVITVHVVDPFPPGAGQVWRSDQSAHLLMNTVASQVTMFTDESVEVQGELAPGPSLYEWARFLILIGPMDDRHYDEHVLAEARALGPDSYPSRAFYGHYLEWVFQRVVKTAPNRLTTVVHKARAVALDDEPGTADGADGAEGGAQSVLLDDGTLIEGLDAVVLAQGHLPVRRSPRQRELGGFAHAHGLGYVVPANPADVDLSPVQPGETVALLGLGLNFFDYMALLTLGRGGRFEPRGEGGRGGLVYRASGREPRLVAGSRRGLPFHSRGENQKGAHGRHEPAVLTPDVIKDLCERSRRHGGIDFRGTLWPLVSKEVETVYYTALLTGEGRPLDAELLRTRYLAAAPGSAREREILDAYGIDAADRWDWDRVARPYAGREFGAPKEFTDWLVDHLRDDLRAARAGNVAGPLKSALDVLRDLRNELRLVIDHGGLTGGSHRADLDAWYTPLNAFLSIGPPARRIEEAIALIEAGVLRVLGPDVRAATDDSARAFTIESAAVPDSLTWATTLIEARLPEIDLRVTADPLLLRLLQERQCRSYEVTDPDGSVYETGGLAVTDAPFHLIDAAGRAHPRRFAFGVPTESVHWATAAGIRPGVNSVTLQDSDAIALAVLGLGGGARQDSEMIGELTR
ncbi:FAD/NAD(P)-binding protein [Streptomyces kanamyceticus]|uniref:FAD-binding protein n=1 Tax=Streptomyces kanamyceticus TaxID=1967 RepID=A0A5J6G4Y4_STRKN|nr:FAD/NAD(P)-binding protein [Streptomyces kanamyceticus]QEU90700.1 FAD-binding protein [Streptomyces kanamyceticus]